MAFDTGSRLGSYEILALIGSGGMGEVYRARDAKLGRDVAIKVLPPLFTRDPERLARFRREAQVLASLNHPHIAHIHGLDSANGVEFLILELVEGETLADRIARGALPLDEALPIARQIGDALAAAHEKGIIHRDLKPANIALTADGQVKVLDFGLAKALEADPALSAPGMSVAPTITSPAMTALGVILGTAAYMAPEQAKGRPADKRSDIWAFGCVLFEMLTGKRAFDGEDVSDTLAAILRGEPDWTALPASLPANVRVVLTKCLARDRRLRFADISTPLFVLTEFPGGTRETSTDSLPKSRQHLRTMTTFVAGALVAAALIGIGGWLLWPRPQPAAVTRFNISSERGEKFTNPGRQEIAISKDGSRIAYVANARLYVRLLSDPTAKVLSSEDAVTGGIVNPVFSPDGQSIAYWSSTESAFKRVPVGGGAPLTICKKNLNPLGMSWNGDYLLIGGGMEGILRVPANGGTPESIVTVDQGDRAYGPQLLPDGDHVLFTVTSEQGAKAWESARIVVQSLENHTRTTIKSSASDGRYIPGGQLLYASGNTVYAIRFNPRRLTTTGAGVPVIEGVRRSSAGSTAATHYALSDTGTLAYIPGAASGNPLQVGLFDREGRPQGQPLPLPPASYEYPRVSPDGRWLAVGDGAEKANIWIYDFTGATAPRRLTIAGNNHAPVWSGDGSHVIFQSDRDGDVAVFWQRADGSGVAERLTKPERGTAHMPQSASRDGKSLLVTVTQGDTVSVNVFSFADRTLKPLDDARRKTFTWADFSPDGALIAYTAENGTWVQPFPATGAKYPVTDGIHPFWSRDGKELFTSPRGGFASVSVEVRPTFTPLSKHVVERMFLERGPGGERNIDIMPDGQHFVGVLLPSEGDATIGQISVVVNWFEELKARIGSK